MVDKARQSGRPSLFAYAKQSSAGSFQSPTDQYNPTSFDIMVNPNVEIYKTLNGNLDSESEVREGIAEITGTVTGPFRSVQGVGLVKATHQQDILSGTSDTTFPTVGAAGSLAGDITLPLTAGGVPSAPAGCSNWHGFIATVGTGGTQEDVPIFGYDATHLFTWPMVYAHVSGEAVTVTSYQHAFQMYTGSNKAITDDMSIVGQWAQITERQAMDTKIHSFNLKGTGQRFDMTLQMAMNSALPYEGDITSSVTYAAGEAADSPFRMIDGGLYSYGAAADTQVKRHGRMLDLDYTLMYALQKSIEGGGGQTVIQNVIGERTQSLTWQENAGEAAFATFYQDFIATERETPMFVALRNKKNGHFCCIYLPRCAPTKFDLVGPTDAPVARSGAATPMLDAATTGIAYRTIFKNGVTSQY